MVPCVLKKYFTTLRAVDDQRAFYTLQHFTWCFAIFLYDTSFTLLLPGE